VLLCFLVPGRRKAKGRKGTMGTKSILEDVIVETIEEKLLVIDSIYPFVTFNWRTTIRQGT
jgi:hypothetical protein